MFSLNIMCDLTSCVWIFVSGSMDTAGGATLLSRRKLLIEILV